MAGKANNRAVNGRNEKKKKADGKERLRRAVSFISGIVGAVCLGYFAYYCVMASNTAKQAKALSELKENDPPVKVKKNATVNLDLLEEPPEILEEYQTLYIKNKSLAGWIRIPDTEIDYPVMQTRNNDYYLNHDFEQNEAYYKLVAELQESIGLDISKSIREASGLRNYTSAKVINEVQRQVNAASVTVQEGFNSSVDKKRLLNQLEAAEESLKKTKIRDDLKPQVEEVKQKLVQKIEEVNGSSNYKINQVTNSIDKRSKRILAIVSDILSEKLSKPLVDDIIEEIVTVLNGKKV